MILAEIRRLEQLLDQNDLGAAAGRCADQFFRARDIRVAVPTAGHLSGRHRYCAHGLYATRSLSLSTIGQGRCDPVNPARERVKSRRRARADEFAFIAPEVAEATRQ